jgi:hypothetical protein
MFHFGKQFATYNRINLDTDKAGYMRRATDGVMNAVLHAGVLRRWTRAARKAPVAELQTLSTQRQQARDLSSRLAELIYIADSRLALPRVGSNFFARPSGTLWSWRPQVWRGALPRKGMTAVASRTELGDEVTLFHDCDISELTLRQLRNTREEDLAPSGMRLDVFRFDGSFLSLVLEMPPEAIHA